MSNIRASDAWDHSERQSKPISRSHDLTLLLARLTWPAPIARERACSEYALLLLRPDIAEVAWHHLIEWVGQQNLESVAPIGFLILVRARMDGLSAVAGANVETMASEVVDVLQCPSLLSWLLAQELSVANQPTVKKVLVHNATAQPSFTPKVFFEKYISAFLPPAYSTWARTIERLTGSAFLRQWGYEWHTLVERVGVELSIQPLRDWTSEQTGGVRYFAAETRMSDVYRSSFLRALAWAVTHGHLPTDVALDRAARTCPLDLTLWSAIPTSRPMWWPHLNNMAQSASDPALPQRSETVDTTPSAIWNQVHALWLTQQQRNDIGLGSDRMLIEASGRVFESADASILYDLEICGVFQQVTGIEMPDLDDVARWYRGESESGRSTIIVRSASRLQMTGPLADISLAESARTSLGWQVIPAAGRAAYRSAVPRWQPWRLRWGTWLPLPALLPSDTTLKVVESCATLSTADDVVGVWADWTDGLGESRGDEETPPAGEWLAISRDLVERFAAESHSTFCWVVRLIGHYRDDRHDPYRQFVETRVFGDSHIALP